MPRIQAGSVAEHRENQRARLLDVARLLLVTDGPHNLNPGTVAAQAGMSRPAVYQYFENGLAMIEQVVLDDFEQSLVQTEAALALAHTPIERAQAYIASVIHQAAAGMHRTANAISGFPMPQAFNEQVSELHRKQIQPFVGALSDLGVTDHVQFALLGGIIETGVKLAESGVQPARIIAAVNQQVDATLGIRA